MFCKNCGNPMDDDAVFCPNCGTAVENEVPAAEPVEPVEEIPVLQQEDEILDPSVEPEMDAAETEEPAFALNTEGEVAAPKKKINKLPFLIGGIVAAVAAVLLVVFNWANVSGFFVRTFSSPEKLQTKVYEDVVSKTFDTFTVSDKEKTELPYDPSNVGVEGEIRLSIDEQILNLIPADGMDVSWLSDIAIGYDMSIRDKMEKIAMDLILGDTSIIGADAVLNMETMEYWFRVPDLNDQAIYMDVGSLLDEMGTVVMPAIYDTENLEEIAEILPSQEVLEQIITRYIGVVMSGFGDVEKSNEKVKVSGVSQNLHVLKATMDEDDLLKMAENLLKTLKKDDDIEDILLSIEEYVGEEGLYDSFVEYMDEALESLDEVDMDDLGSFKLTLITYLNDANEIVGNTVKLSLPGLGMGMKYEPISWVRVEQGKKFASELVISAGTESIVFEGKGENGKTTNSEYTLSYDGEELLTVEIEDYVSTDNQLAGTVRIVPSEYVMENMMSEMDLNDSIADLIGSASPALEIDFSGDKQGGSFSVALAAGAKKLIAISSTSKITGADAIEPPTDYVEYKDDESLTEWTENMKTDFLDTLMNRLIEAGVPAELFEVY
ncbi:MAG: zinc ribbon domain-containing protein [Oscillospiraceae bacterium]|nr:zinc ribbon domain-containing protein [Oscillospiraceae bacterium]